MCRFVVSGKRYSFVVDVVEHEPGHGSLNCQGTYPSNLDIFQDQDHDEMLSCLSCNTVVVSIAVMEENFSNSQLI